MKQGLQQHKYVNLQMHPQQPAEQQPRRGLDHLPAPVGGYVATGILPCIGTMTVLYE